jgi:hypothetical protein
MTNPVIILHGWSEIRLGDYLMNDEITLFDLGQAFWGAHGRDRQEPFEVLELRFPDL